MSDPGNPIFDCNKFKPMRTRTFRAEEDGKPVTRTERRPQGKYLMVVDSFGNVLPLKLHNAISEQAEADPYRLHQRAVKTRGNKEWGVDGMIPALVCPQQTEAQFHLPDHLQTGTRCLKAVDGVAIGEDHGGEAHYCKCITALIQGRRERNAELEASRDPKTTIMQAVLNNSQETTAQLTQLLANLVASGKVAADPQPAPVKDGKK